MTTNTHILTINDHLGVVKSFVRGLPDSAEKEQIMLILNDATDHLMQANTDMSNVVHKVCLLTDQVATLNRAIYEPVISGQMVYPEEGDYNAVREYVEQRKEHDPIFRKYCDTHTRKQLCDRLTDEFGWPVDPHSFTVNLNRQR